MGAWGLRGKGGRWGEKISEGKSGDGKWQGRVEMEGVEECRKVKKGEEKGEGRSGWGMRSRAGSRAARRRRQERGGREARGGGKGGGERRRGLRAAPRPPSRALGLWDGLSFWRLVVEGPAFPSDLMGTF